MNRNRRNCSFRGVGRGVVICIGAVVSLCARAMGQDSGWPAYGNDGGGKMLGN
jgi:stringent starvation protein B